MRFISLILLFLFSSLCSATGDSEYSRCVKAQEVGKLEDAIFHCTQAVEKGSQQAKLVLGHLNFMNSTPDLELAIKWYLAFAESKIEGYQYGYAMAGQVALQQKEFKNALIWFELCNKKPYKGCGAALEKLKDSESLQQKDTVE